MFRIINLMLVFFILGPPPADADQLTILTEEYPPYQTRQNGTATGLSVEIVRELLKDLKIDGKIRFYPWARAWDRALKEKNILLFSVLRNTEREELFHWVGPLTHVNNCLFSTKDHTGKYKNILDIAKAGTFKIGAVRGDVFEKYLTDLKYDLKKIERNNSHEANYKMLLLDRLDFWAVDEVTAKFLSQKEASKKPLKKLYKNLCMDPSMGSSIYLVLSKSTSKELHSRFEKAFATLRQKPVYTAIIEKYRL